MKDIKNKEQEVSILNEKVNESLSKLVREWSTENLQEYESIVIERQQQHVELHNLFQTKWADLCSQWQQYTNGDSMADELLQKFDSNYKDTLRFGGTTAFLENFEILIKSFLIKP